MIDPPTLAGPRVRIRPLVEGDAEEWRAGLAMLERTALPLGVPSRVQIARRLSPGPTRRERDQLDLAIEVDGRLIGDVQTQRPQSGRLPDGVFQVGIAIFRPGDRGRGYGAEALGLFVDWLFDHGGATRVQAGTAPDNEPMARALLRLGFGRCGDVVVGRQLHVLYALERDGSDARARRGRPARAR